MKYLSWGLRGLLTVVFLGAGGAKLAGVEMMVASFDQLGVGQWFRYVTGAIEVVGAALLWVRGWTVFGAGMLGATMVGAVLAHLLILGPSAMPAVVLGLMNAAILYLHRDEVAAWLGRKPVGA